MSSPWDHHTLLRWISNGTATSEELDVSSKVKHASTTSTRNSSAWSHVKERKTYTHKTFTRMSTVPSVLIAKYKQLVNGCWNRAKCFTAKNTETCKNAAEHVTKWKGPDTKDHVLHDSSFWNCRMRKTKADLLLLGWVKCETNDRKANWRPFKGWKYSASWLQCDCTITFIRINQTQQRDGQIQTDANYISILLANKGQKEQKMTQSITPSVWGTATSLVPTTT